MSILVTGASGFLGKFLVETLLKRGKKVIALDSKKADLTEKGSLRDFDSYNISTIYHLAAWTQAGDFCLYHSAQQWFINQKINLHVLDWWVKKQPQAKMVSIGTSCSYDPEHPLKEEFYLQGKPIDSLFTYAMTKRMLLTGLQAVNRQYGLKYLYVIPSTLYGPSYHEDGRQMHFIFDLVRKILEGKFCGKPVILWGDGKQEREIIHVFDFIRTLLELEETTSDTWINIGAGKGYSIRDFAQKICKLVGFPWEKVQFDSSRYVGARSKILDIEKLRKLRPNLSFLPLEEGLKDLIEWFCIKKNYSVFKADVERNAK